MDTETLEDIASSWNGTDGKFVWEDEVLHEDDAHRVEAELDRRRDMLRDM